MFIQCTRSGKAIRCSLFTCSSVTCCASLMQSTSCWGSWIVSDAACLLCTGIAKNQKQSNEELMQIALTSARMCADAEKCDPLGVHGTGCGCWPGHRPSRQHGSHPISPSCSPPHRHSPPPPRHSSCAATTTQTPLSSSHRNNIQERK